MGDFTGRRIGEMKKRALRAYTDLVETADWFRERVSRQLETFNLTVREFRTLQMLLDGPAYPGAIARKLECSKTNAWVVVKRMERQGWVRREESSLPPAPGGPEKGRRIVVVSLSAEGKRVVTNVLPKHVKVVTAQMRVLDAREQDSLSHICRKLRKGDILKFAQEMMMEDVEE